MSFWIFVGHATAGKLLAGAREWNSALTHVTMVSESYEKRKAAGYMRRTGANALARWEGPMVEVWGEAWRLEERHGKEEKQWKEGREDIVNKIGENWGIKGLRLKGKAEKEERAKGKKDDPEARQYKPHAEDRKWDSVGRRCKFVCDNQTTANLLNRQAARKNSKHKPLIDKSLNVQYEIVKAGWRPFNDSENFMEWRRREFNKVADHVANETIKHRKSFSYCNKDLREAIRPGNANILVFSDGGAWAEARVGASAWVAYVLGGHWGSGDRDVHLLAAEGLYLDFPVTAFHTELIAAESALSFVSKLI